MPEEINLTGQGRFSDISGWIIKPGEPANIADAHGYAWAEFLHWPEQEGVEKKIPDRTRIQQWLAHLQQLDAAGKFDRINRVVIDDSVDAAVPPLVHNYGLGTHTLTVPAGYTALHVQLCGGAGGGGGGNARRCRSGEFGGHGGCTFGTRTVAAGDTLEFILGRGGAGGDTDDDPGDGRPGTASTLRHNGTTVWTGDPGRGGDAAVRDTQRAAAGAAIGDSEAFPAAWPGDVSAPQGGARGYWPADWDGRRGAHGAARVLLV